MFLIKIFIEVASKAIGIKLCPAPQISEHCPMSIPGRLIISITWFIRPGVASAFTPKDGIVQEWRTSFEVTTIREGVCVGSTKWLDVSIRRLDRDLMISEEKLISFKLEYWYPQFHWYPIPLTEMRGAIFSSIRYKVLREGIAINSNIRAGKLVQKSSISWASKKKRLKFMDLAEEIIK